MGDIKCDVQPSDFDHPADYRQWLRKKHVEAAVEQVFRHCWSNELTAAESKLAWAEVIAKLVDSVVMDRSAVVVVESLGLKEKPREAGGRNEDRIG